MKQSQINQTAILEMAKDLKRLTNLIEAQKSVIAKHECMLQELYISRGE